MYDFMNQIPRMLVGEELQKALTFLPEYNENIRNAGADVRLQKLSEIHGGFIQKKNPGEDRDVKEHLL